MNYKKISVGIVVILAVIYAFLVANSFNLALQWEGLTTQRVRVIEDIDIDSKDRVFQVVQTTTKAGDMALVRLVKSSFGFWMVDQVNTTEQTEPYDWVSIAWVLGAGIKRYTAGGDDHSELEWHMIYYGTNAIKEIKFNPSQIPENVAINIQQVGNEYWIHLISFENSGKNISFDLISTLEQNGCLAR